MSEYRVPITAGQHAKASMLLAEVKMAQKTLEAYCEALLDSDKDRPKQAGNIRLAVADGVHQLVLDVPEPAAPQE